MQITGSKTASSSFANSHRVSHLPWRIHLVLFLASFSVIPAIYKPLAQNAFFSIDYSCLGHLSSIVFLCICRIPKMEKMILVNLPPLILIGDPRGRGSPIKMNGGKFTLIRFLSYECDKYKKILLNSGVQGMSNQ